MSLNYEVMENQLRMVQDMPTAEQEVHRASRELLATYNAQMQAFRMV
jgi:hypothetical protein